MPVAPLLRTVELLSNKTLLQVYFKLGINIGGSDIDNLLLGPKRKSCTAYR